MDKYEALLNQVLDQIEYSETPMKLVEIARMQHISPYHFERIFSAGVGIPYNQYVLSRRLTKAADMLITTDTTIMRVAIEHGFEYAEVFSRAFKRQFGMSPKDYRQLHNACDHPARLEKAIPMFRPLINHKGGLTISPKIRHHAEISVAGLTTSICKDDPDFNQTLLGFCKDFMKLSKDNPAFSHECFFNIVQCLGDGMNFNFFVAKELKEGMHVPEEYRHFIIPEGKYATITYEGRMAEVRPTFEDDLYRWLIVRGMEIRPVGFSMSVSYGADYPDNPEVTIQIPIK